MLLTFWLFKSSFTSVVTITFTALILSEILNVFTTLNKWSKIVIINQLITLLIYVGSIVFLREMIDVSVIDLDFGKKVAIITLCSWGPVQIMKWWRVRMNPTEAEKIMKSIKAEKKNQK